VAGGQFTVHSNAKDPLAGCNARLENDGKKAKSFLSDLAPVALASCVDPRRVMPAV
jgi:hypothetical protein